MSDLGELGQEPNAEAGPEGAPGAEATPPDAGQEQIEYLDLDDSWNDKHVRLTIDGQETSVPFKELLSGGMRQGDYTRKTQELADQRKELAAAEQLHRAFQANPGLTVQILAERSGMSVQQFLGLSQQQQNAAAQQATQQPQYEDPLEQALAEQSNRVAQLEQRLAQEAADRELSSIVQGIQSRYGADIADIRAAIEVAMQNNMPPSMLPVVYESLAFRKGQVQQQTRQQAGQVQQLTDAQRQAAAQAAAGVVAAGTGAVGTTATPPDADGRMSLAQSIAAATAHLPG